MVQAVEKKCWGILWRSDSSLDGEREFLVYDRERQRIGPLLFGTRKIRLHP